MEPVHRRSVDARREQKQIDAKFAFALAMGTIVICLAILAYMAYLML